MAAISRQPQSLSVKRENVMIMPTMLPMMLAIATTTAATITAKQKHQK